jgi:hypothetical protein
MISLVGRRPAAPGSLALDCKAIIAAIQAKAGSMAPAILNGKDFIDHWGKHKHLFILPQHDGKCAYCEVSVIAGMPGDVEHFRPKSFCQPLSKAKTNDDYAGKPPYRKTGIKSSGYWWLAYEWSNYLLACNRCNSLWKKNQFPIAGTAALKSSQLTAEHHLLINPYDTDPEPHFAFDENTGQIRGRTARGTATIEVCGLDRKSLEVQRAIKGEKLISRHGEYLDALVRNNVLAQNNALRALLDECQDRQAFAGLARYFVQHKVGITYSQLTAMRAAGQM